MGVAKLLQSASLVHTWKWYLGGQWYGKYLGGGGPGGGGGGGEHFFLPGFIL